MRIKIFKLLLLFNSIFFTTLSPAKGEQVRFELLNGDSISGELIEEESNAKTKVLLHPDLGRIQIDVENIVKNDISDDQIQNDISDDQKLWTGAISIGLRTNNTETNSNSNILINTEAEYEGEKNLFTVKSEFDYITNHAKESGFNIEIYEGSLKARNDYFLTNNLSIYTSSDYFHNSDLKAGMNDLEGSIGLGYFLFNNNNSDLFISLGPGLIWSQGGDECATTVSCGDLIYATNLEASFEWILSKYLEFELNNTYQNADGEGNRAISSNSLELELKFRPDENSKLFTSLIYENNYHDLSNPYPENKYKLTVGTSF